MRLPVIEGVIDRRLLVNYRVDPRVLEAMLPPPFRPQLIQGYGIAGICLIRLRDVRPAGLPQWLGLSSENAAHRIAVEWEADGTLRKGVYILRRDTSSWLNALAGGRIFPGLHCHARFVTRETRSHLEVAMRSDDGQAGIRVVADLAEAWSANSLFTSLADASQFFAAGSLGYSPSRAAGRFQGLELCCRSWSMEPLIVRSAQSSLFDDPVIFPHGTIQLDNALLMHGIEHEWRGRKDLCWKSPLASYHVSEKSYGRLKSCPS